MISHRHACIFIHVQRTAGTSIEYWLAGNDWWYIDPATKHLTGGQAKERYGEYWDDYFTFALVRNPWERIVSLAKFRNAGITLGSDGTLCLDEYIESLGDPPLEFDRRYWERSECPGSRQDGHLYGNTIGAIDYIGRYESLHADLERICDHLHKPPSVQSLPHHEQRARPIDPSEVYSPRSIEQVRQLHFAELNRYGYSAEQVCEQA